MKTKIPSSNARDFFIHYILLILLQLQEVIIQMDARL